jgi:hypothetical protein
LITPSRVPPGVLGHRRRGDHVNFCNAAIDGLESPSWVKLGKPQAEHMSSGLPSIADMERTCWQVRFVP